MARISSPNSACTAQAASLVHWPGLAGGGDHHGPLKFVIVSLAGWGTLLYGGYKFFTKDKKDKKDEKVGEPSH
ncbi:hypothetical protein L3X38_023446 [Prunus dulcis]|uniref:Uncharacterized protein n=1 Tax=Prunus dulcis TaxID=3755 RepID=A0AAD4VXZ7_PRUDU|nr:hypothetical protein L3X38_023446 [Prunus dulcis]